MTLRDIRADLHDRLEKIKQEAITEKEEYDNAIKKLSEAHNKRMDQFRVAWESIQKLLAIENQEFGDSTESSRTLAPVVPLADFFIQTVSKYGFRTKEELRADAQKHGYFAAEGGGRSTNITLRNIVKAGRLTMSGPDTFTIPPTPGENDLAKMGTMQ